MKQVVPKIVVLVVYKTKQKDWRGFCAPYDVTCNAPTASKAKRSLEELVELYEDGLKKYHFPKHLSIKSLSDINDRKIFSVVMNEISKEIKEKMNTKFLQFQEEQEKKNQFREEAFAGSYYFPQVVCA